jgi:hypothetical protein
VQQHRRWTYTYRWICGLHHQCAPGLSTVNCPADALVAPTPQRLSMPVVTPDADQYAAAAGLLAKGISSGHLPIPIVPQHATGPILYGGYAGLHHQCCARFVHVNCLRCVVAPTPQRLSMPAGNTLTRPIRRRPPALLAKGISSGHLPIPIVPTTRRLDLYLYGGYAASPSVLRQVCHVNCPAMRWWRDPPTVVDAVVNT